MSFVFFLSVEWFDPFIYNNKRKYNDIDTCRCSPNNKMRCTVLYTFIVIEKKKKPVENNNKASLKLFKGQKAWEKEKDNKMWHSNYSFPHLTLHFFALLSFLFFAVLFPILSFTNIPILTNVYVGSNQYIMVLILIATMLQVLLQIQLQRKIIGISFEFLYVLSNQTQTLPQLSFFF